MDLLKSLIVQTKNEKKLSGEGSQKWLTGKQLKNIKDATPTKPELMTSSKDNELERLQNLHNLFSHRAPKRKVDLSEEINISFFDEKSKSILPYENNFDENYIPPITKDEIFSTLRKFREPITLFGETDAQRFNRMCQLEITRNDDGIKRQKQNLIIDTLTGRDSKDGDFYDDLEDEDAYEEVQKFKATNQTPSNQNFVSDDSEKLDKEIYQKSDYNPPGQDLEAKISQSDNIKNWIKSMLKDWEEELHNRSEIQKKSTEGRMASGMHRQTRKDLKPLLKKLKSQSLENDVLAKLSKIVDLCRKRMYRDAHDIYMLLAIGNAAWPMGVTMVGIHERAGRSKIFTSEVAHILNDETTRKYIQMFKRLMSFCQRKYPADPSQMVKIASVNV